MKRFAFGLEKVLKFKEHRKWLAEIRQQQAAAVVHAAQAEAATLQDTLNQTCLRLQEQLGKAQDPTMWMAVYAQAVRLEEALQSAGQKVERARQELDKAAASSKQAAIEVEMLLTLRQQKWQEYRHDCQQADQEQLDDLGLRRWMAAKNERSAAGNTEGASA